MTSRQNLDGLQIDLVSVPAPWSIGHVLTQPQPAGSIGRLSTFSAGAEFSKAYAEAGWFDGFTWADLAGVVGLPPNAPRSQIAQALKTVLAHAT